MVLKLREYVVLWRPEQRLWTTFQFKQVKHALTSSSNIQNGASIALLNTCKLLERSIQRNRLINMCFYWLEEFNYFYLQMIRSSNMKYKSPYWPDAQLERFQYTNSYRRAWNTMFEAIMMNKLRCRSFEMSGKVSKNIY